MPQSSSHIKQVKFLSAFKLDKNSNGWNNYIIWAIIPFYGHNQRLNEPLRLGLDWTTSGLQWVRHSKPLPLWRGLHKPKLKRNLQNITATSLNGIVRLVSHIQISSNRYPAIIEAVLCNYYCSIFWRWLPWEVLCVLSSSLSLRYIYRQKLSRQLLKSYQGPWSVLFYCKTGF